MGGAAAELADVVVVTSDNPRTEEPMAIIDEIVAGISGKPCHIEPDRHAAIAWALKEAGAGDIVLIAGKGHETYQEINHQKTAFDDRAEVRSLTRHGR